MGGLLPGGRSEKMTRISEASCEISKGNLWSMMLVLRIVSESEPSSDLIKKTNYPIKILTDGKGEIVGFRVSGGEIWVLKKAKKKGECSKKAKNLAW